VTIKRLFPSHLHIASTCRRVALPLRLATTVLLMGVALGAPVQAQTAPNEWTWIDGSSTVGSTCVSGYSCGEPGVYGTKGTIASGNTPGSRSDAMSWTDVSGRKWLFGGFGYGAGGALGEQNDLWQADASGNAWGWISGSNGPGHSGVYGTMGTPSATTVPGGREGGATWTDKSGNLWLFGGLGYDGNATSNYGYENDLWMYNPTTNQWTWKSGSSTVPAPSTTIYGTLIGASPGVYGTLGTPAAGNTPSGRTNATAWIDSNGNLWLFGGGVVDELGYEDVYNDLWEFDTTTKLWTWVAGGNTLDELGVYGTFQTPASGNAPGARYLASGWTDSSGNFWLFGGSGYASNAGELNLNDLWKFSTSTSQWTWMGGASILYPCNILFSTPCPVPGTYGTRGTAASTNFPGARNASATWTDSSGNLWLFGGSGQDANNFGAWLNDLWEYNPGTTEWTWMGGGSTIPASCTTGNCGQPGVYGSLGTAASANVPGARLQAVSWTDQSGDFWLFGGWGIDENGAVAYLNDMWEYQPSTTAVTPEAQTITFANPGTQTVGTPLTLSATATSGLTVSFTSTTTSVCTVSGTQATFVAAGTCTIDANQAGNSTYAAATMVPQSFTVNAAAVSTYTVASPTGAQTVQPGGAATYTINVTPVNGSYTSAVMLTVASGLPVGATATFAPTSITPGSSSASSTLTIQTAKASAALTPKDSPWPLAAPALALIGLFFLPGKRRRRWITLALLLFASLGAFTALTACGGGFDMTAPAATYTITVTGTSGATQQTATVQLTVQ